MAGILMKSTVLVRRKIPPPKAGKIAKAAENDSLPKLLVRRKILPPEAGNNCLKWRKQEYCVNTV